MVLSEKKGEKTKNRIELPEKKCVPSKCIKEMGKYLFENHAVQPVLAQAKHLPASLPALLVGLENRRLKSLGRTQTPIAHRLRPRLAIRRLSPIVGGGGVAGFHCGGEREISFAQR